MFNHVLLEHFVIFPEYLIGTTCLYVLIILVLTIYSVYGLIIQQSVSECFAIILIMTNYLILNDNLLYLNFTNFANSIINDCFSCFVKIIICTFSSIYFFIISNFLKEQYLTSFEFLLVILFAILGLLLMCESNDLITSYLAIELSSLSFYILSSYHKTSGYSVESGLKYFIIGSVASSFFLFGSTFIYGITGSINICDYSCLFRDFCDYSNNVRVIDDSFFTFLIFVKIIIAKIENFSHNFLEIGLILVLISLFIKLALAPFHFFILDIYEGSPTNSVFFFAVITKLSVFVLLFRLCYFSFFYINCWHFYSFWVGFFSVFIGCFGGLTQRKFKTLLAYSAISHMGFVLISFSSATFVGIQMSGFYLFIYIFSGLILWHIFLLLKLKTKFTHKKSKELSDFILLKKSNLAITSGLALSLFSIAGIPPLTGFLAKLNVFLVLIGNNLFIISFIIILFSVNSTFYYLRIIKILYFETYLIGKLYHPITTTKTLILSYLILGLFLFFINPTFLYLLNSKVIFCTL